MVAVGLVVFQYLLCIVYCSGVCTFSDGTLHIDGVGGWNGVSDCLMEPNSIPVTSIEIVNCGSEAPIGKIFYGSIDLLTENLIIGEGCHIAEVNSALLVGFPRLRSLVLRNLGISRLIPNSFYGLQSLEYLDLSENLLSSITFPIVQTIDVTGNPLERGCIPGFSTVIPNDILPPCSGYRDLIGPMLQIVPPYSLGHIHINMFKNFVCATDMHFMEQQVRRVFLLGSESTHYGIVFVFEHGFMLTELTLRRITGTTHVKSTCVRLPVKDVLRDLEIVNSFGSRNLVLLAEVFFGLRSCVLRRGIDHMYSIDSKKLLPVNPRMFPNLLEGASRVSQARVLRQYLLPNLVQLQGVDILQFGEVWEKRHSDFMFGVDSCITFAHVLFRRISHLHPSQFLLTDAEIVLFEQPAPVILPPHDMLPPTIHTSNSFKPDAYSDV